MTTTTTPPPMPIIVGEAKESRGATVDFHTQELSAELVYKVVYTNDENIAHAVLQSELPRTYRLGSDYLYLHGYTLTPMRGGQSWQATAKYKSWEPLEITWSGDTSGGTVRITQSLKTVESFTGAFESGEPPDFKGAMNVKKGQVEGTEIYARSFSFSAEVTVPRAMFTPDYQVTLYGLTSTVNDKMFRGQPRGDVLFIGAQWVDRSSSPYIVVTYKFLGSPAKRYETGEIGEFEEFTKEGWQYFWQYYKEAVSNNSLIPVAYAGYVEQVYEYGNFDLLGLGS
ncbi:MAG: hypothetical protein U0840_25700 [Gemmataceae bacterium]